MAYLNRTKLTLDFLRISSPTKDSLENLSGLHITLAILHISMGFWHDARTWIHYAILMASVIAVWMHVKAFEDVVAQRTTATTLSVEFVIGHYNNLKAIFSSFNSIFGPTLLSWVVYLVPYIALRISEFSLHFGDWFFFLFTAVYFSHVFIFLILAADSASKVYIRKF